MRAIASELLKIAKELTAETTQLPYLVVKFVSNKPVALVGGSRFDKVWYQAIQLAGGLPYDIEGNELDSIQAVKARLKKSPSGLVMLIPSEGTKHLGLMATKGKKVPTDSKYKEV